MINFDQFKQVEMKVGLVIKAEKVIKSTKLIKLEVDLGEEKPRTIFTAVRPFGYTPQYFLGKKFIFVTNLEPKKIMNDYSQGMILAVDGQGGKPAFIKAGKLPTGAKVK